MDKHVGDTIGNNEYLPLKPGDTRLRTRKHDEKQVRQIVFEGKRFDAMNVREWRELAFSQKNE